MILKTALVALTPLLLVAAAPRSGPPRLDVESTCRATQSSKERLEGSDGCLRDEREAQRELRGQWSKIPADVRRSCTAEVTSGGPPSYVELLTCVQMNAWSKEQPDPTAPGSVSGRAARR